MCTCVQQAYTSYDNNTIDPEAFSNFLNEPVHAAMATCSSMRPAVDISVGGEGDNEGVGAGAARVDYRSTVSTSA